jgi:hypothetical protein
LAAVIEDVQGLAPGRLLGIVDLAQIQDGALGDVTGLGPAGDTAVLDDAEVAVLLAVLPSLLGSEEHAGIIRPTVRPHKKAGLHYSRSDGPIPRNARYSE